MTTFLFVLGTGRCGSTLVQELLLDHRDVGFVSIADENLKRFRMKGRWNSRLYRMLQPPGREAGPSAGGILTRTGARARLRAAPTEGYALLSKEVSPLLARSDRDLTAQDLSPEVGERFRRFFEVRARAQHKPVFVHKFTGWPRARYIWAAFPEARFVHVVRDGRAVAASLLRMPWWKGRHGPAGWGFGRLPEAYRREWEASGGSLPLLAGLEWKVLMDAFEVARAEIPEDQWLEVRYEELVRHPEEILEQMLRFAGLKWSGDFDRRFRARRIQAGPADRWRRNLSGTEARMLEASLAGHLSRWGYESSEVPSLG